MLRTALLEVRALPWRPRTRVMKADTFRGLVGEGGPPLADDIAGLVIGLGIWILLIVAAPVVVLVLAAGLFSFEVPAVLALGAMFVLARFAGLIPWTVVVVDVVSGEESRESYRNLVRAVRRIRAVNTDRRVTVRWAWA